MISQFEDNGYKIVNFDEKPDIFVINSCSVTNLSARKSRQILSRAKKINGNSIVILTGCYAEEIKLSNLFKLNNVDIILGNEEKKDIIKYLNNYKKNVITFKVKEISKVKRYIQKDNLNKSTNIRESIKIEDGCNNFCSYCIIPYTRGRVRSRSLADILDEVNIVSKNGASEIILVGIEIASYGTDLEENISLIDVIEEIDKIDTVKRIRLGSIDPKWLTDSNIDRLKNIKKVCNHFHISVQSLSNGVLARMNRKYTREYLFKITNKLKETFDDVAITCDVIVGYIDETYEEFQETLDGLKKIEFSDIHVFKFSKRLYTKAYNMQTTVSGEEAIQRSENLISISNTLKIEFLIKYIGKTVDVLLEEYKDGYLYGYTSNYIKVKVKGGSHLWGKIQRLELVSLEKDLILGMIK